MPKRNMNDMFNEDQDDAPDLEVGGVEWTVEELAVLVQGFHGRFYSLYARMLNEAQRGDIDSSLGTEAATDQESMYRAKGSYLVLKQLKDLPADALAALNAAQNSEKLLDKNLTN